MQCIACMRLETTCIHILILFQNCWKHSGLSNPVVTLINISEQQTINEGIIGPELLTICEENVQRITELTEILVPEEEDCLSTEQYIQLSPEMDPMIPEVCDEDIVQEILF